MQHFLQSIFFLIGLLSFVMGVKKSRQQQFYSDTWMLLPLGIYVWGDAIVLGPFWMASSILFSFLTPLEILRFGLFFYLVRSVYEVIYWITHQVAQKEYVPPLFRRWKWLHANESAILYQLIHMCVVLFCVVGLLV